MISVMNWILGVLCLPPSDMIYFTCLYRTRKMGPISFSAVCAFSPPVPWVDMEPQGKQRGRVCFQAVAVKDLARGPGGRTPGSKHNLSRG